MLLTQAARSGRKRKTIMKQRVSRLSTGPLEHGNLLGFVAIAATSYCSMENTSLRPWRKEGDWVGVVVGRGRGSQKDLGISAVSGIRAGMDYYPYHRESALVRAYYYPIGLRPETTKR